MLLGNNIHASVSGLFQRRVAIWFEEGNAWLEARRRMQVIIGAPIWQSTEEDTACRRTELAEFQLAAIPRASFHRLESGRLDAYCTLSAAASRTTLPTTAVSALSGKCEQKPMPT